MKVLLIIIAALWIGCSCPNPKRYDLEIETIGGVTVDTLLYTVYSCKPVIVYRASYYELYVGAGGNSLKVADNVEAFSILSYKEGGNYIDIGK